MHELQRKLESEFPEIEFSALESFVHRTIVPKFPVSVAYITADVPPIINDTAPLPESKGISFVFVHIQILKKIILTFVIISFLI